MRTRPKASVAVPRAPADRLQNDRVRLVNGAELVALMVDVGRGIRRELVNVSSGRGLLRGESEREG